MKSIDKECVFVYYEGAKRKNVREKRGEVMERRTQRRVVRKSRKIRKNTFVLLTMALILCLGTLAMGGQKGIQKKTYYECVQVEKGDTLWEIAKKYHVSVDSIREQNLMDGKDISQVASLII